MIERIRVQNFKAIADAELSLTPLHLLIGPNDSGKTSFLEAIAAVSRCLDHSANDTFLGRWSSRQMVHNSSNDRIGSVNKAQELDAILFPRAFGVAVETFDAWFLADEVALSDYLGINISTQPDPESRVDPKSDFTSLRDIANLADGLAQCYSVLAMTIDLDKLAKRCPKGFLPWMQRVSKL